MSAKDDFSTMFNLWLILFPPPFLVYEVKAIGDRFSIQMFHHWYEKLGSQIL